MRGLRGYYLQGAWMEGDGIALSYQKASSGVQILRIVRPGTDAYRHAEALLQRQLRRCRAALAGVDVSNPLPEPAIEDDSELNRTGGWQG